MTKNIAMRSGGEILVDQLLVHGVDTAFCVPGESYLDVLNALSLKKIRLSLLSRGRTVVRLLWLRLMEKQQVDLAFVL
jgi:hypothetical protein